MTNEAMKEREATSAHYPTCSDYDEDCELVDDKVHCYLYDPAKGMCPYLRGEHLAPDTATG